MSTPHALIVGAGIGGLSAALTLARSGWRITLVEQTAEPSEVGAGLQISPNASRVLLSLGLGEALEACACHPLALEMRSAQNGRLLSRMPLGESMRQRYGAPYLHLHRADLHGVLLQAARELAQIECVFNARVILVEQNASRVSLCIANGRELQADLLIGADGIHSLVRATLFGAEHARFTGCVAWRGVIPASRLRDADIPRSAALWLGPGAHFVHYYLRRGELLNFVAVTECEGWEVESWTQKGEYRELFDEFGDWPAPVSRIIEAADPAACFKWALFDRPPMPQWSQGRVSLLGDACHPTLPFMAQGAAMAIEDAAVLASCLRRSAAIPGALLEYEQLRRARTAEIQNTSRDNKRRYHYRGAAAWARDLAMPALQGALARKLDALYGYDPLRV
ncbi:salicylate hydroxylase [Solimonas aquatica]|uniref:Salicylate hydroxylase n=1 Tax=Solimonas aquatica TaxID=489703 RepID=A0A1H9CGA3_9GAMM|nr:FAD-dependent oxidoreductase [Solimonas aquatica]SEQ00225.1 salicylate hydroxylase [Solimonas aquatica]